MFFANLETSILISRTHGYGGVITKAKKFTQLIILAPIFGCLFLSGCISPVVVSSEFKGIGLFYSKSEELSSNTEYSKNIGVGLYISGTQIGFGFVDQQSVKCDQLVEGEHVHTPLGEIVTGEQADKYAREMVIPFQ